MAAPLRKWFLRQTPKLLSMLATRKETLGGITKYKLNIGYLNLHETQSSTLFRILPLCNELFFKRWSHSDKPQHRCQKTQDVSCSRPISDASDNRGPGSNPRPLKLMDFEELIWPNPLKSIRNAFFSFLIKGYFDEDFSNKSFLDGGEQAVNLVSNLVSNGKFSELDGLVTREAQREIRRNYELLTCQQRKFIAINPKDIFFRFIHEIGVILDDQTNERFVEITAVFQGVHGLDDAKTRNPESFSEDLQQAHDHVYVCNYRFVREYTKGKDDDWIINKLNHFKAKELVARSDLFRR